MLHFNHIISLIVIYVMTIHDVSNYGMGVLWTKGFFLFMEHDYYLDQLVNPIPNFYSLEKLYSFK